MGHFQVSADLGSTGAIKILKSSIAPVGPRLTVPILSLSQGMFLQCVFSI